MPETLGPNEIQIGDEVVTNPNDVYRKIIELLIANGQLEGDTTVDDVLAFKKPEFQEIINAVRTLIATSQIVLPEEGNGPCGQTLQAAISNAKRTRTIREKHRIDKVHQFGKLTKQYLATLEEPERTRTTTRLLPLFTREATTKKDNFTLQVAKMPPTRYQLLGIDNIKKIPDGFALQEAIILDEEKVKAITPYHLADMQEQTIRAIRENLPASRIQAIGGENLVGKQYITIEAISLISDESFRAMDPVDTSRMTLAQLQACTNLSPEQVSAISSVNLLEMDQYAIKAAAQLTVAEIGEIGARQLAFLSLAKIENWIKHNRTS